MAKKNPYTPYILNKIKTNTEINNHSENYYLIAKTGDLSTEKGLKKIYEEREKVGYRDSKSSKKQYELYKKSMKEIESKYGTKIKDSVYMRT